MLDRFKDLDGVILPRVRKQVGGRIRSVDVDQARFKQLWAEGLSVRDMAAEFNLGRSQISRIAKDLALPERRPGPSNKAAPSAARSTPAPLSADARKQLINGLAAGYRADALPLRGGWTRGRDLALAETGGVYANMADLARKWKISMQHVMARWHRMRKWVG